MEPFVGEWISWLKSQDFKAWKEWQWLPVIIGLATFYFAYYLLRVVRKPKFICGDGPLKDILSKRLKVLEDHYWPTFWCFTAHLQTICRVFFKSKPFIPYRRESLETPDGGLICLDWVDNDEKTFLYPEGKDRPILLIMPGLTGCSDASYCRHLVLAAKELGFRSLVFHNRGLGKDIFLKTPRTFCANNTEDLRFVLAHLKSLFPAAPILATGISLGGCILSHYLTQEGDAQSQIFGAFVISVPWDTFKSCVSLEQPLNWLLFNRHLTRRLLQMVNRNVGVFEQHIGRLPYQLDHVMKSNSLRDFDDRFTSKTFGYRDHVEYYTAANLSQQPLHKINTPTLFLNAFDDPFAPGHTIPYEKIRQNPKLALILTDYGGHIGFIEGIFVKGRSLVEKMFMQFAQAMLSENEV